MVLYLQNIQKMQLKLQMYQNIYNCFECFPAYPCFPSIMTMVILTNMYVQIYSVCDRLASISGTGCIAPPLIYHPLLMFPYPCFPFMVIPTTGQIYLASWVSMQLSPFSLFGRPQPLFSVNFNSFRSCKQEHLHPLTLLNLYRCR